LKINEGESLGMGAEPGYLRRQSLLLQKLYKYNRKDMFMKLEKIL
jgi:hypothetical protein